jgi:putative ABC transport system permease protein
VNGAWPQDDSDNQALLGITLASELHVNPGDELDVAKRSLHVTGILNTGGDEDREIVVPLHVAQELSDLPNAVSSVFVSALTKPEDDFARRDPASLSPKDRDRQYCSPYALSIARQIMEAIPGSHADQIRRVAQSEGSVLSRVNALFLLIALAALISAVLAVSAATATAVMERRHEIGLMKALGAGGSNITVLFLSEAAILALVAGACGFGLGELLAQQIGRSIFNSVIAIDAELLPIVLLVACAVAALGSIAAIRRAASANAAFALRGEA